VSAGSAEFPIRLTDGRTVEGRRLRAEDAPGLVQLFSQLSPQDIRRRFFGPRKELTIEEADRLAGVDQRTNVALCAVESAAADDRLIAVGRFHSTGPGRAELALAVAHSYQDTGLGRQLLARLLQIAQEQHLDVLEGQVLAENKPMLHLLQTAGHPLVLRLRGDVLSFELEVREDQG
jgi:RimJ/RimL family protein N-acetyltransferase